MARSPLPTGLEGPLRAVGEVPFGKTVDPKGSNYVSVDENADVSTEPINIGNLVPLLRQYDRKRDKFFRCLGRANEQLEEDRKRLQQRIEELELDCENERRSRLELQEKEQQLNYLLNRIKSNSFVVALIHGDRYPFIDDFLQAGAAGGERAATTLKVDIQRYIEGKLPDSFGADWDIFVRVFVNLEGLATELSRCHKIESKEKFLETVRAFNSPFFNVVDVGLGKERAVHCIREMLRVHNNNVHCKHIIIDARRDGVEGVLKEYMYQEKAKLKITFLETISADWVNRGFSTICLPSVFQTIELGEGAARSRTNSKPPPVFPKSYRSASAISARPSTPSPLTSSQLKPPNESALKANTAAAASPRSSTTGTASSSEALTKAPTWAEVSGNSALTNYGVQPKKGDLALSAILFNKDKRRVDPRLPNVSNPAASGKACNEYYLRLHCESGKRCGFSHGKKLTSDELNALRIQARKSPCSSTCKDPLCYKSHHCQFNPCNGPTCVWRSSNDHDSFDRHVTGQQKEGGEIEAFSGKQPWD